MNFTGKYEDQGGTTGSESKVDLLRVVEQSRNVLKSTLSEAQVLP